MNLIYIVAVISIGVACIVAILIFSWLYVRRGVECSLKKRLALEADNYRRYFDAIMESMPLVANYPVVSLIDQYSCYIATNEAFTYLCGYTENQVIGEKWHITIHPDDVEIATLAYQELVETGLSSPVMIRGMSKDGRIHHQEMFLIMCRDREGRYLGYLKFEKKISDEV